MLSSSLKIQDKSLQIIIPLVVGVHILIAIFFSGMTNQSVPLMQKKGVVVHSVKLNPKIVLPKVVEADVKKTQTSEIPKTVEVVEVKKTQAKVEIAPKTPATKSPPKPKPVTPKPQVEKKQVKPVPVKQPTVKNIPQEAPSVSKLELPKKDNKEWIAKAKEKIGKIALSSDIMPNNSHQNLKEIATPSLIENLVTDLAFIDSGTTFNVKESAYRDELGQRLRLYLKLPEYGDVKVKLTIDRTGKVIFTKILSFQSAKNAAFIEQNLPKLKMPPFGDNFKGVSEYDFTIVLSNE